MALKVVVVKSSKEAVRSISSQIVGKPVRITNVFSGQNLSRFGKNDLLGEELLTARPRFDPDCSACLTGAGYTFSYSLDAFIHRGGNENPPVPKRLAECQLALSGSVPKISFETADKIIFTLGLAQGCRGGMGATIFEEENGLRLLPISDTQLGQPNSAYFVFGDNGIVPVHLLGSDPCDNMLISDPSLSGTRAFWRKIGMDEQLVKSVTMENVALWVGPGSSEHSVLGFLFEGKSGTTNQVGLPVLSDFMLFLDLGPRTRCGESLMWIEVIDTLGTTRYEIDTGFKPLLFPKD